MTNEQKEKELSALKNAHDHYANSIQILTQRVQYYPEEFQTVSNTVEFLSTLKNQVKSEIEKYTPVTTEEAKEAQ